MPTYTYQCKDCKHRYDVMQSMKEDPHTTCPECSGSIARLIGAGAGILFKGSGFYVTDYRKQNDRPKNEATTGSESKGSEAKSGETKSTTEKSGSNQKNQTTTSVSDSN